MVGREKQQWPINVIKANVKRKEMTLKESFFSASLPKLLCLATPFFFVTGLKVRLLQLFLVPYV